MTTPTIYARIYERLADLIPNLTTVKEGETFFAASRNPDDMAVYCNVSKVDAEIIELELANDLEINGEDLPAPWMVFRIDMRAQTAELLVVQDEWRYEVVYSESNLTNPRRAPMNLYAVNWLTIMLHIQSAFQPVIQADITA